MYNFTITTINATSAMTACHVLDERFDADFINFDTTKITVRNVSLATLNMFMAALAAEDVVFTDLQIEENV